VSILTLPMSSVALLVLLGLSVWHDWRHRRIPNRLLTVFVGLGLAHSLGPVGPGLASALGAALLGAAAFAPLYLRGAMGGGDLKLMATTGLWLGLDPMPFVCLAVAICGGVLALAWMWRLRRTRVNATMKPTVNPSTKASTRVRTPVAPPAHLALQDRMPYALAIAAGTLTLGLQRAWAEAPFEVPVLSACFDSLF